MITARDLIAASRAVDPDTPVRVVVTVDDDTRAAWGWDVDFPHTSLIELRCEAHRLELVVTPATP